jgi:hypothetical protein
MGKEKKKNRRLLGFLGLLGACAAQADVAYEVSTGVGHSDNISRVEEGAIDESLASVGLMVDWEERTRHLSGDALVNLSYVEYLEDTYDGEVLGTATGNVDFGIVPERFHWLVEDTFGQARTDPFEPVTPDNRENINYFSTGPELRLRFGQSMTANLYGRYSDTRYEDSPLDAERVSVGAAFGRDLSERSNVALNFSADESTFDEAATRGYQRRSAFASYELGTGGRTTVNAELGYSWLEMDGEDEEDGGLLVDLSVTRELTASTSLTVSAGQNFSDAGEALDSAGGGGMTEITASADPFESTEASAEWQFTRRRTSIGLGVAFEERSYETQSQFDSKSIYYRADFARQLRSTLRFETHATLVSEDFENGVESDTLSLDALLDWQFGRRVGLQFRLERSDRSSSMGTGEFTENRAYLGFTFRGSRQPGSP